MEREEVDDVRETELEGGCGGPVGLGGDEVTMVGARGAPPKADGETIGVDAVLSRGGGGGVEVASGAAGVEVFGETSTTVGSEDGVGGLVDGASGGVSWNFFLR